MDRGQECGEDGLKRSGIGYFIALIVLGTLVYFGLRADHRSFVASLFAAVLSVFVVFFIEMKRKPRISIVKEKIPPLRHDGCRFLRVNVENRALKSPLNLVMDRNPALQARAWITFLTESGDLVFTEGHQMIGRWSKTPEPVRPISISQSSDGTARIGSFWDLSITRDAVDIASGAGELLDIVMRSPGEEGCRGWHNRIIENPKIEPEDEFDLSKGRYHALVRVDVSGRSFEALFRIVCDVGINDFRLEPID
jgi:hypothetical protein